MGCLYSPAGEKGSSPKLRGCGQSRSISYKKTPLRGCVAKPDIEVQGAFAAASLTPLKRYE